MIMPLPFIIGGLAVGAGVLGAAGHAAAKDDNEEAQRIAGKAENLYNEAKESLECLQKETEASLIALGNSKEAVLKGSIQQFLQAYDRIKNIELKESSGLNELSDFMIDKQDTLQLREISNIYTSSLLGGAAGAAAGTAIVLAASGTMPLVGAGLSMAGASLAMGEIGLAAGCAASGLAAGLELAAAPLAPILGPVLLFSGFSASMKADENLEKARTMKAEAEAAVEKMKIAETMCTAISDRAKMFDKLLTELNGMFSECTVKLSEMVNQKADKAVGGVIDAGSLTEDELKLVAVTRSFAGAVKAVIDTPILNKDGGLCKESKEFYYSTVEKLPMFNQAASEAGIETGKISTGICSSGFTDDEMKEAVCNICLGTVNMLEAFLRCTQKGLYDEE